MKPCLICGDPLDAARPKQRYCSRRCMWKAYYRRKRAKAARPVDNCIQCGKSLPHERNAQRRYCDWACRQKAWRRNRQQVLRQERRRMQ